MAADGLVRPSARPRRMRRHNQRGCGTRQLLLRGLNPDSDQAVGYDAIAPMTLVARQLVEYGFLGSNSESQYVMFVAEHLSMPVVNGSCPHEIESVLNHPSRGWESQIRNRPPVLCLRFLVSATIAPATLAVLATLAALATCSNFPICAVRPDCPSWVSTSSAFFLCYWFFLLSRGPRGNTYK